MGEGGSGGGLKEILPFSRRGDVGIQQREAPVKPCCSLSALARKQMVLPSRVLASSTVTLAVPMTRSWL